MADSTTIAIGSVIISLMSFAVSAWTMYFAWVKKGDLRMTQPTLVFFGFDTSPKFTAKIYLRALLYSTAAKGQVIEGMYAKLLCDGAERTFSFWGHGEIGQLTPGSGMYVGQAGVATNHHFVLPANQPKYEFVTGDYSVEVFARLVGNPTPIKLSTITLAVDGQEAAALRDRDGVLFELQPETGTYIGGFMDRRFHS